MTDSTVRVCAECEGPDNEIQRMGPDLLDVCPCCRTIEGKTEEITEKEYEERV